MKQFRVSSFGFRVSRSLLWVVFFLLTAHCTLHTAHAQDTPLTNKFPGALNSADSLGRTSDRPTGTLTADINSGATSLGISGDPGSFPSSGISLVIDNEIILCTARSSGTVSGCLRGQKGTSAAGHLAGVAVRSPILSAERDVTIAAELELEKKLGYGTAPASGASTGYCLKKNGDGTTSWAACSSTAVDAKADGATKGEATFTPSDFNDNGAGLISTDYANGQAADASHKGFLTPTDWSAFNGKQAAGSYEVPLTFSTGLTRSTNTITVNTTQNILKISGLTTNGLVKTTGSDGTLGIDTNTYLTGNQTITLSGDVSGSGATSITTAIGALKVTNSMLAGSIDYSKLAAMSSANLRSILNDENGTGAALFDSATSPTFFGTITAAAANFSGDVSIGTVGVDSAFGITLADSSGQTGGVNPDGIIFWAGTSVLGDFNEAGNSTAVVIDDVSKTITFNAGGFSLAYDGVSLSSIDATTLGSATNPWFGLMLGSGAALNFNNGDVTVTHSTDLLTVSGGDLLLSTGNLDLKDAVTGFQSALTTVVQLQPNNRLQSAGYASQTTGWAADGSNGAGDFRYLYTDELRAKLFTVDLESVLAGSQRVTKSFSTISQTFTAPAASGTATLWVADSPTFGDAAVFVSGDAVVIHNMSRTVFGPFTISDCVGVVTAYADGSGANAGQQSWTFTRNSGGNAGTMTAATTVAVNNLVQDLGTTGNGYVETSAVDGAAGVNAPYTQIVTWATAPVAANLTVRARLGNLKGISGTAEYGLIAGTYSASNGAYFRASDQNFDLHGITAKWWDTTTNVAIISPNSGSPYISLGSPAPTAYGANAGVFLEWNHTAAKARASFYADANNYLQYDGTKLTWKAANTTLDSSGNLTATSATLSGAITATSGAIGGWTINSTSISSGTTYLASGLDTPIGQGAWFGKSASGYQGFNLRDASTPNKSIGALVGNGSRYPYFNVFDGNHYRVVLGGLNWTAESDGSTDSMGMKIWDASGNLLVKFSDAVTNGGNTIAGWTISSTVIQNSGATVMLRSAGNLAFGSTPPTESAPGTTLAGTGLILDSTGMYGLLSNVVQAKFDAATGRITAGAGGVALDVAGITIAQPNFSSSLIKFFDNSVNSLELGGYNGDSFVNVRGSAANGIAPAGRLMTRVDNNTASQSVIFNLTAGASSSAAYLYGNAGTFLGLTVGAISTPNAMLDVRGGVMGYSYQWVTGTRPTCAVGNRGTVWYVAGGAGVLDTFEVCRKDAANAYAWVSLF